MRLAVRGIAATLDRIMYKILVEYDQSLASIMTCVEPLAARRLALDEAVGCVLRRNVQADRDQPPFDRSAIDGFAVRS